MEPRHQEGPVDGTASPAKRWLIRRSRPDIDERHWFALMSDPSSMAGARRQLEHRLTQLYGASRCLATHRGTTAFDLLWSVLPLRPGDEVVLSTVNYVGVANSVLRAGGVPVLVDTGPDGLMAGAPELATGLSSRTRVLIATHLFGRAGDAPGIRELADRHGAWCVEDCAHAFGVTIGGRPAGSFGHAAVLSFGFEKHLTAGRGGALIINDARCWNEEQPLREAARETDLDVLLGAWFEYRGSDPALCRYPFRLDRTGHEALQAHPSLRRRLFDGAAAGAIPDAAAIQVWWDRLRRRQQRADWWKQTITRPVYQFLRRSLSDDALPGPAMLAMGDLRAAVCLHEWERLPRANQHRRTCAQRLMDGTRDWPGGCILSGMDEAGSQPLQLPLLAAHPARAEHITRMAMAAGIELAPHPWGLPLHHYRRLAGRFRPAATSLPVGERAMPCLRMIPLHPSMRDTDLDRIAAILHACG